MKNKTTPSSSLLSFTSAPLLVRKGLALALIVSALPLALTAQPPAPAGGPRALRGPGAEPSARRAEAPAVDPSMAGAAVTMAQTAVSSFAPGAVWVHTGPAGDTAIEASVLYQNSVVARLRFDENGAVLPKGSAPIPAPHGVPPPTPDLAAPAPDAPAPMAEASPSVGIGAAPADLPARLSGDASDRLAKVRQALPGIVKALRTATGAELNPGEGRWSIPLIWNQRIVGDVSISNDGKQVIENFAAARDAAIFVR